MLEEPSLKPVVWVGSSRRDLRAFPDPVQDHMGYAIYVAQQGGKHRDAKVAARLRRSRGGGGGQRFSRRYVPCGVYAEVCRRSLVLHAFQKKSKTGRETPRREIELIEQRLREAEKIATERKL